MQPGDSQATLHFTQRSPRPRSFPIPPPLHPSTPTPEFPERQVSVLCEHPSRLHKGPFHSRACHEPHLKMAMRGLSKSVRLSTNSFLILDNPFLLSQRFPGSPQALVRARSFRITPSYQEQSLNQATTSAFRPSHSSPSPASHNPHVDSFSKSCPLCPQRCPDYVSGPSLRSHAPLPMSPAGYCSKYCSSLPTGTLTATSAHFDLFKNGPCKIQIRSCHSYSKLPNTD